MGTFVKSSSEFEGSYSDVWVLVEDDQPETWTEGYETAVVGHPQERQDARVKVQGTARYTVDQRPAGVVSARVVRSPVAAGVVSEWNVEAARAVPGVLAVITDADDLRVSVSSPVITREPRWVGQPVALIVASTEDRAREAERALAVRFEARPVLGSLEAAVAAESWTKEPDEQGRGDARAAIAAAHVAIELEARTPGHIQSPLEPHAAVAAWDGERLTVWASTQGMFAARSELASALGLAQDDVRVVVEFFGGGFGGKQGAGFEGVAAAALSRIVRRPVRIAFDRHADQLAGGHRAETRQRVRLGATADGELVGVEHEIDLAMGIAGSPPPASEPAISLYTCPNVRVHLRPARSNLRPMNAFRAPGVVEATTGFEQAIDELCLALGADPLEWRRTHAAAFDQRTDTPYASKQLDACYRRAAELAGWSDRARLADPHPDGLLRGMGCATQIWWGAGGPPARANVRIGGSGVALVTTGIQDIGTGTLTAARMVAAESLGLPYDQVRVIGGDTAPNVYGPVAGGSQTSPSVLPAVHQAASRARKELIALAAEIFEANPDDIELVGGRFRSLDGALDEPLSVVCDRLGSSAVEASGARAPNPEGYANHTFGCQIAQVSVDPELGTVRAERIVAVHDVGRIVNPLGASSQMEGGIIQGVGYALLEERLVDAASGVPVSASFDDYHLPTIADVPEILFDWPDIPDNLLSSVGSKGLGEPPIIPTAAAIANAFRAATGVRLAHLPLTSARVLAALGRTA